MHSYDPSTSKFWGLTCITRYTYAANDQLQTMTAQGNTTLVNGTASYQYNPFNRLASAGGATNYIAPDGQRLRKAGGSTGTTYFAPDRGGALMAENDNGIWVDYVRLNGRLIGRISGGQVDAIHDDQVGRPEEMTNASQGVVWRAQNFPFTQKVTVANVTLNLGFPGQYYDAETGTWNNGYRDYNSGLGRYLESDPLGLAGGMNTYAYVGNNPLTSIDPLGLCPKCTKPPALPNGASVKANIQQIQMDRAFAGNTLIFTFYNLVRNGGPWDYKQQNTYPQQYGAAGNFNYGATGAAAGFSTRLLLGAAGYAQIEAGTSTPAWRGLLGPLGGSPYGDDPADQAEIKAGIAYYNCLASGGQ